MHLLCDCVSAHYALQFVRTRTGLCERFLVGSTNLNADAYNNNDQLTKSAYEMVPSWFPNSTLGLILGVSFRGTGNHSALSIVSIKLAVTNLAVASHQLQLLIVVLASLSPSHSLQQLETIVVPRSHLFRSSLLPKYWLSIFKQ